MGPLPVVLFRALLQRSLHSPQHQDHEAYPVALKLPVARRDINLYNHAYLYCDWYSLGKQIEEGLLFSLWEMR